jgi:hypothetical protein
MILQHIHVKQIAAKDILIAEKHATVAKQQDNLTVHELTVKRLNAEIEALKAAHEEEIEILKQRWEKEANQCSKCRKNGHEDCQNYSRGGGQGCWGAVKFER